MRAADLARRQRRVQPYERVEPVLQHDQHVEPAQELAQHDALVDTLAAAEGVARIADLLPVLEGGAAVIAPEFGARVQCREIGQGFGEAARLPVGGAAAEIIRDVIAETRRELLLLDRRDVEIGRGRDMSLR